MTIALAARALRKRFGKVGVLDGLSLQVPQGAVYGFLGRNGAGKTTALRVLTGVVRADAGTISIFGREKKHPDIADRRRIGIVTQEPMFYPWMTADELGAFVRGFFPTWDAGEFTRLLAAFEVPPDRRASLLSGGTRAKLGLALALAHRPELLILDEPTAGLDPVARRELLDLVQERTRVAGHTVIFSSHLVDEVQRTATVVGILERGALRFEGPPMALLAELRRFRALPEGGLPAPFSVLSRDPRAGSAIVRAPAEVWAAAGVLDPAHVGPVSLEDAFLALVTKSGGAA